MKDKTQEEFKKELEDLERKSDRLSKISSWISTAMLILGLLYALGGFFTSENKSVSIPMSFYDSSIVSRRISILEGKFKRISVIDSLLKVQQERLSTFPNKDFNSERTQRDLDEVKMTVNELEKVIMNNPEKAISILLLKNELENTKTHIQREQVAIKDEIEHVYDMNKWIIGLVISLLVSIMVLNVGNILSKSKK